MSELKSKEEIGTTKQKSIFSFLQQQSNKKKSGISTLGQATSSNGTLDEAISKDVLEDNQIDEITPSTSRMTNEHNGNCIFYFLRKVLDYQNLRNFFWAYEWQNEFIELFVAIWFIVQNLLSFWKELWNGIIRPKKIWSTKLYTHLHYTSIKIIHSVCVILSA